MFSPFSVTTGWLRSYLTNILGEFIKKECFESLTASLWHGTLVIENAELQETILDSLGLPISLRRGTVGRLEVTVPWTSITTSSIVIRLQNLELVADARYDFADEIARCLRARALAELEAQKKAAAEKKIRVDPTVEDKEAEPGMLGRLGTTILDNLLVIVAGVHIRVEDRVTCPQVPFAYGFTADSITYRTHEKTLLSTTCRCVLERFSMYIDCALSRELSTRRPEHTVIEPVHAELSFCSSHNPKCTDTPQSVVELLFGAVTLQMSSVQLAALLAVLSGMSAYSTKTTSELPPLPPDVTKMVYPVMYVSSQFKLVIPDVHVRFIQNAHPFAIVALKGFMLNLLTRQSSSRMELCIASVVAVDAALSTQHVITTRANALGVPAFQLISDDAPIDSKPIDPEVKQPSRMNIVLQPLFIRYDAPFFSRFGDFFSGPSITDDELLHTDPPSTLPPDSILSVDIPSFRVVVHASEPVTVGSHVSAPFTPSRSPLYPKAIHFGEDPRPPSPSLKSSWSSDALASSFDDALDAGMDSLHHAHQHSVKLVMAGGAFLTMHSRSRHELEFFERAPLTGSKEDDDEVPFREAVNTFIAALDARLVGFSATLSHPVHHVHHSGSADATPIQHRLMRVRRASDHHAVSTQLIKPFDVTVSMRTSSLLGSTELFDFAFADPGVGIALDQVTKRNVELQPTSPEFVKDYTTLSVRVYSPIEIRLSVEEMGALQAIAASLSGSGATQAAPPAPTVGGTQPTVAASPLACGAIEVSLRKLHISLLHHSSSSMHVDYLHSNPLNSSFLSKSASKSSLQRTEEPELRPVFDVAIDDALFCLCASNEDMQARLSLQLCSYYHNSRFGSWEPLLEPWRSNYSVMIPRSPASLPVDSSAQPLRVHAGSEAILNINLTEAALETLADVLCFINGAPPRVPHVLLDSMGGSVASMAVRNGSRIVYPSSALMLLNRLSFPLSVSLLRQLSYRESSTVWHAVVLPGFSIAVPQHLMMSGPDARHLKFRFRIAASTEHDDDAMPALGMYQDILAVDLLSVMTSRLGTGLRRNVRVTNMELRYTAPVLSPAHVAEAGADAPSIPRTHSSSSLGSSGSGAAGTTKTFHGLASFRQDDEACRVIGRLMTSQPDAVTLDEAIDATSFQADSVTCDADSDSDDGECEHAVEPVHAGQPVRVLSFHAPVCVINRLLVPVSVRLLPDLSAESRDEAGQFDGIRRSSSTVPTWRLHDEKHLQPGDRVSWYHEHCEQALQMQVQLPGFMWSEWVAVDKAVCGRHWLRCVDLQGNEFRVGADIVRSSSGSLRVAVFAPFWIFNRGAMPLLLLHSASVVPRLWNVATSSRAVAGQKRVSEHMSRFKARLRQSQVGLLALVPSSEDAGETSIHSMTMVDFTDPHVAKCVICLQAPHTLPSDPVDLSSLTSTGIVVELEERTDAVAASRSSGMLDALDQHRSVLSHQASDIASRASLGPAALKRTSGKEKRRAFVFGISADRKFRNAVDVGPQDPRELRRSGFITVAPRFLIVNTCAKSIYVGQSAALTDGAASVVRSGDKIAFHWADSKADRTIRLRFAEASWSWSGAITPDVGDTVVRIQNSVSHSTALLRVVIHASDDVPSLFIVVSALSVAGDTTVHSHPPPYRIHNLSMLPVRINQANLDSSQELVLPYRSVEYAWAEPLQKKELVIDVMTVGAPTRLGTVLLDKLGPSPPRRIGAKLFRVRVRAEGPTRVCEISDADRSALTPMLKADTAPNTSTLTRPIHCSVSFAGLGISMIDHRPRELLYTLLQDITAEYLQTRTETKLAFALRRLEIDNQAIDTVYPILLEPQRTSQSVDADSSSSAEPRVMSMFRKDPRDRVIEFSLGMLNAGSTPSSVGVHYVKYCILKIEPLEVAIDLHLIDKLVSLSGRVTHMFEASLVQTKPSRFHRIQSSAALNTLHPLLEDPSDDSASSRAAQSAMIKPDRASNRFVPASMRLSVGGMDSPEPAARARMAAVGSDHVSAISQSLPWYFERLIIRPTAVRLSTSAPSQLMASPLAYLATLQDAQLRFDAVQLGDLLLPLSDLTGSLGSQYKKAAYTNLFRILLSSRVLIAPSTMLQAIMSGLHGFYFESSKGFYERVIFGMVQAILLRAFFRLGPERWPIDVGGEGFDRLDFSANLHEDSRQDFSWGVHSCDSKFAAASRLLSLVYSRIENEGEELLGRAGDGVFKHERYVFHTLLSAPQVAIVITDVAVFCMGTAADKYFSVQWRVHFNDFLFAKQEGRSLKLFCMPCRARGVGRLVGATPTLGPAAVHSAALHSTAEYGNTRLSLMPGGVRRKSHGVSKLHAVDTHSRVREPVTLHLPALFHNRLEDDVPIHARAAGAPAPARPAHISFSVFDIECPSDEAAADLLTRISQHAAVVRERLGQQSRHARKIGQRGDGLVLTREARHHHQPQPNSTVGFQRTTVGVMVALLSVFAMSRL